MGFNSWFKGLTKADYLVSMKTFLYFFITYNFLVCFMTLTNFRKHSYTRITSFA